MKGSMSADRKLVHTIGSYGQIHFAEVVEERKTVLKCVPLTERLSRWTICGLPAGGFSISKRTGVETDGGGVVWKPVEDNAHLQALLAEDARVTKELQSLTTR